MGVWRPLPRNQDGADDGDIAGVPGQRCSPLAPSELVARRFRRHEWGVPPARVDYLPEGPLSARRLWADIDQERRRSSRITATESAGTGNDDHMDGRHVRRPTPFTRGADFPTVNGTATSSS